MHKAILHTGVAAGVLSCSLGLAQAADDDKPAAAPGAASAMPLASPSPEGGPTAAGVVIVTGTRATGLKAENSASPVQVLDATSLQRTGQPDLIQALAQNLPSLNAQAFGGDMANMTLSARLRGLSPNNTLVLVNGKRRHGTANLAVLGGPYQGGAAADLNYIPVAAIDHIEVLQDGAAAQYGTDAIAGVVNIILKSNYHGGTVNLNGGQYMDGGGRTGDGSANMGFTPFADSFLSLTVEDKYHGFSDRGGIDPRVNYPANLAAMPQLQNAPGYPYVNHISGDAQYHQQIAAANFGADFANDVTLYSFATYGHKKAAAFENYRMPNRLPKIYPLGFSPQETFKEDDFAWTVGLKGKLGGDWRWDLSSTYGRDEAKVGIAHSGNVSLFNDTGSTPLDFYAGKFVASQWTNNLDLNHDFELGWATPLTFAVGLEQRRDSYEIGAGQAEARYKEGSQAFPGFSLSDAGSHSRTNEAAYVDLSGQPLKGWTVDLAGRYEHFSDFGNAKVGKLTTRYDLSPAVGIRGTYSNGFRAPTLAEEYYSATNVSPTSAYVQLPPNSPAARLVGVNGLKPEASTNLSAGIVINPSPNSSISLDAYQITIRDRIVGSGSLYGSGGAVNSPAVTAAIQANGNVLDPTVTFTGINIFSNAVNTRTKGLEFLATLNSSYGAYGKVDWSLSANWNTTSVIRINQAPTQLQPQTLLDASALSDLETASPRLRVNLGALWKIGALSINARESWYGKSSELGSEDGSVYYETRIGSAFTTDLELGYQLSKAWSVSVGANNLFNKYPNGVNAQLLAQERASLDNAAVTVLPSFSPIGINGGYYYARLGYRF
jgi:iron complex outermembrane receptor protein